MWGSDIRTYSNQMEYSGRNPLAHRPQTHTLSKLMEQSFLKQFLESNKYRQMLLTLLMFPSVLPCKASDRTTWRS